MARSKSPDGVEGSSLVPTNEPKDVALTQKNAGAGFEGTDASDFLIPIISILQKMSPQVDEDSDAHIPGAKAGTIFNTATQDLFDGEKGIKFIPVARERKFVEWVPREDGGGFVGTHLPESPEVLAAKKEAGTDFGKLTIGDHQLVETYYMFGLLVDDENNTMSCVLPFSSSQIKVYKTWMTKARGIKVAGEIAALFAHAYRLTTFQTENKKGKWHTWRVTFSEGTPQASRLAEESDLYVEAEGLRELISQGIAKIDQRGGAPLDDAETKSF